MGKKNRGKRLGTSFDSITETNMNRAIYFWKRYFVSCIAWWFSLVTFQTWDWLLVLATQAGKKSINRKSWVLKWTPIICSGKRRMLKGWHFRSCSIILDQTSKVIYQQMMCQTKQCGLCNSIVFDWNRHTKPTWWRWCNEMKQYSVVDPGPMYISR